MDFTDLFRLGENMRKFVNLIRQGKYLQVDDDLAHKVRTQSKGNGQKLSLFQIDQKIVGQVWEQKLKELDGILLKMTEFKQPKKLQIDWKIITDLNDLKKVKNFMPREVKQFQLLYRASENQFLAKKFHEKCDGKGETLTLVETEFGKVIGGFTPLKWKSPQTNKWKQDPTGQSFLFSMSLNEKYELIDKQNAVLENKLFGPGFEGGVDLAIGEQCNIKQNCRGYFPHWQNNGKYQSNQETWTAFSGQTYGNFFKIKQYEVFKVVWK